MTIPFTADAVARLSGPSWLQERRQAAMDRFSSVPLPTEAEEIWRYSRIGELDLEAYAPVPPDAAVPGAIPPPLRELVDLIEPRAGLVVVRNGRVAHVELDEALQASGLDVSPVGGVPDGDELLSSVAGSADVFVDLNTAFAAEPIVVRVPARMAVRAPLVIANWVDVESAAVFPRVIVDLGEAAELTLVDTIASPDGAVALAVPVVELHARDASNLRYLAVQTLGTPVWQVAYQASQVDRDATLESTTMVLGGDYARVRTDSRVAGQGATSNLLAAYFGDGNQMHDFRTLQDHDAPRTTSDLLFKGAVTGSAHSVYSGMIRVRKGARGTNAFQTNRNLVLTEGAHADSVPNLEIEENDVRCSHASAVGPIDEDQRYYLEARGVPTAVAERLIVLGFFEDVVGRVPVPALRAALRRRVAGKLGEVGV